MANRRFEMHEYRQVIHLPVIRISKAVHFDRPSFNALRFQSFFLFKYRLIIKLVKTPEQWHCFCF
jgi:hypothetical protein